MIVCTCRSNSMSCVGCALQITRSFESSRCARQRRWPRLLITRRCHPRDCFGFESFSSRRWFFFPSLSSRPSLRGFFSHLSPWTNRSVALFIVQNYSRWFMRLRAHVMVGAARSRRAAWKRWMFSPLIMFQTWLHGATATHKRTSCAWFLRSMPRHPWTCCCCGSPWNVDFLWLLSMYVRLTVVSTAKLLGAIVCDHFFLCSVWFSGAAKAVEVESQEAADRRRGHRSVRAIKKMLSKLTDVQSFCL